MRFATLKTGEFVELESNTAHVLSAPPWRGGQRTHQSRPFTEADLACPVSPSKILCIGRNYVAHAKELGNEIPKEPLFFLKPPSALIGPNDTIVSPPESERVEHEAELAVVIGRRARRIDEATALSYVFGYTCAGDITARDLQKRDVQFTRAKGFDTFCPVGPWIETDLDPTNLRIRARVNGQARQDGSTSQMVFPVAVALAYVSRVMTLEPGDIMLTGSPEGVGPLLDGDRLEIEIGSDDPSARSIGTLRCDVVRAQ